jgi:hypothetical protein
MGRSESAVIPAVLASIVTGLCLSGLVAIATAQQPPAQQAKPPAPIKPYPVVATTLPTTINDPSFDEFRRQLGEVAVRKDKAALGKIVVTQGFFWRTEKGEKADKNKSSVDNLTAAIQLDAADGSGWDSLASYAFDPTAAPVAAVRGVICSPADPVFNDKELESLIKSSQTDLEDWGYPLVTGVEVRSGRKANDPVIETLGLHFIRVLIEENVTPPPSGQPPTLKVVTPSGKVGYLPAFALAPLGNDQLCYRKDSAGWKIAGFIGGEP